MPDHLPPRLSREEVAALLAQPNRRAPTGVRDRALIRLFYRAGLRCNEALDLKTREVDLDRLEVRVHRGKGDKDRQIWFDAKTGEILQAWKDRRPRSDWFFSTLKGDRMDDSAVRHMLARRGRKAGIEIRVFPHLLRHTFASEFLEDGGTIIELQQLLGHADLKTTLIYSHTANERLRRFLADRPG